MEVPMNFPPPPRTVELTNPDGETMRVNAYGRRQGDRDGEEIQRVRWNPTLGRRGAWEMDPEAAQWEKSNGRWTLATIAFKREQAPRNELLSQRCDMLEAHSENLIQRVRELEQRQDILMQQIGWFADQFALDMPVFDPRN